MGYIRETTENDKEIIYRLLVELEEKEFYRETYVDIYKSNLLNSNIFYLVYEEDSGVVGFISIYMQKLLHHNSSIAEIQEFIVDKNVRGQGIGKKLFKEAKMISMENKCTQLEV